MTQSIVLVVAAAVLVLDLILEHGSKHAKSVVITLGWFAMGIVCGPGSALFAIGITCDGPSMGLSRWLAIPVVVCGGLLSRWAQYEIEEQTGIPFPRMELSE